MALILSVVGVLLYLLLNASAASFPPTLEGVSIINSTSFPGRSISYKETTICETTEGVKSYSGYVNLPADPAGGRDYEVHTFFWFFEARTDPKNAPLSLWLQGGPGAPSVVAAVGENGPCLAIGDSKSTVLNPWSWNNKVNMLYIDQPVQVGFSYNELVNGTLDELKSPFFYKAQDFSTNKIPDTNITFLTGTFASPNISEIPYTAVGAAPAMWDFMQTWIQEFPEYQPDGGNFSIWAESYGGHYAPIYSDFFQKQSSLISTSNDTAREIPLHVDTIGLVNACIDIDSQMLSYPQFAFNNTYGIQAINETQYQSAVASFPTCRNMSDTCRTMADKQDPLGLGNNDEVNKACSDAYLYCFSKMHDGYDVTKQYQFDITSPAVQDFPPKWAGGYLNTAEVQQALGVALNFTGNSAVVAKGFGVTGDFVRGHSLDYLGSLLDKGVKVALVYGDRDYQCNWLGGEAISLAIDSNSASSFSKAGYANIDTNSSYVGGLVRQHGNLSFSRVFQAGHEVPYYQPETAYQIFNRVMFNEDVATGKTSAANYSTQGPSSAFTKSALPVKQQSLCYLWDIAETCTPAQQQVLAKGRPIVKDFILIGEEETNGTDVFYNGTHGGNSGNGSSTPGTGNVNSGAARGITVSHAIGTFLMCAAALVVV
ncbi:MAG: hypothetical protein M1820_003604 [Bogoriella megaspora]|nr:MAG: hypothetical protein M1820_003604 [Bogoriella megaspora]